MSADPALGELSELYEELGHVLAKHRPRCELSGRCCDFETSGHVLFSTDLEVAYARVHGGGEPDPGAKEGSCPWFRGGLCELRDGRPLGCRVYFCDPDYAETMQEIAERFHRRVVEIHEKHGLSYRYTPFVRTVREDDPRGE